MTADSSGSIIVESDRNVLSYRMGQVEQSVTGLREDFRRFTTEYPTSKEIALMIQPLAQDIDKLKKNEESKNTELRSTIAQFKFAITMAILSPIFVVVATRFMENGGTP